MGQHLWIAVMLVKTSLHASSAKNVQLLLEAIVVSYMMLSYRRETALQGAL